MMLRFEKVDVEGKKMEVGEGCVVAQPRRKLDQWGVSRRRRPRQGAVTG
jgi:hypothetical protein